MRITFTLRGRAGQVDVGFAVTDDPAAIGAWPGALGLPHCQAMVTYPGRHPTVLPAAAWEEHRPWLAETHPGWSFAPGLHG